MIKKVIEHSLGEQIVLEVVEGKTCQDCYFASPVGGCGLKLFRANCWSFNRKDRKDVIYKLVK